MSKIHLYRKDAIYGFTDAETECGIIVDNDFVETIDHTKVKCERCKKTQAFKDLERTNNETKKAIEEMNEIKEEAIKKFKDSEQKTYKQKIEIEVDVPVGYEFDDSKTIINDCDPILNSGKVAHFKIHVKPKVKTGAELVRCLCGVSAMNISEAKIYSENLQNLKVVNNYKDGYYGTSGGQYKYVYPVPAEKLAEFKANLEREV